MTKAELIRKIVKRSGIPDSEAKVFFEIFLQKTSAMLKSEQAVILKNLGYFQLRQAVFTSTVPKFSGQENSINTEIIVFTSLNAKEGEGLVFNIPALVTEKYNLVDSYFSLSIGKPVIPLRGVSDTDYFMVPAGYEMRKLIETKVAKLLDEVEIIENPAGGNDVIYLKKPSPSDEHDAINWSTGKNSFGKPNVYSIINDKGIKNTKGRNAGFNEISWDFGEDLSRQIEEEAIIDESSEPASALVSGGQEDKSSLVWDFGDQFSDNAKTISTDKTEVKYGEDDPGEFQRVKAITAEFNFDDKEFGKAVEDEHLEWDFGKEEILEEAPEELKQEEPPEDRFVGFKVKVPELPELEITGSEIIEPEITEPKITEPSVIVNDDEETLGAFSIIDDDEEEEIIEDNEEEIAEDEQAEEEFEVDKIVNEAEREFKEKADNEIEDDDEVEVITWPETKGHKKANIKEERPPSEVSVYSKKKSTIPFIIAMFTIVAVAAAVFIYINKISLYDISTGKFLKTSKINKAEIAPKIIDRNYDVPVTYPYPKDLKQNKTDADTEISSALNNNNALASENVKKTNVKPAPDIPKKQADKKQEIKIVVPQKQPVKKQENKTSAPIAVKKAVAPVENPKKANETITQQGKTFVAQISSWPSKEKAESEAAKFKAKGFNSYVEKAELPGRGTWYRVKVGNFKTAAEAEKFSAKYK